MFNNDIYDSDINVTRLSSVSGSKEKEVFKTFECKKGMRMYSRFFFVTGGKTKFVFFNALGEEKCVEATKGDLVYLPDDIAYFSSWIDVDEIDYISIEFQLKDKDNNSLLLDDEIFIIATDKYGLIKNSFEKFYNIYTSGGVGYKIKLRAMFFEILSNILSENALQNADEHSVYVGINFLENNFISDVTVKELSKMSSMCQTAFRQKFHKIKGMAPIEYKNYLRIKHAAELLLNDDYTVAIVAETVNIPDICYFSKLFKRYIGVSPRAYKLKR